ncbi:MAG: nucleoside triphosphate pyrophosphohydrolase family protein [Candidatus Pacebacteria bacterium]|nr:nucleoside triphosphate pyrophosphohydrolase family protein [Candidatus Paceibacterota bacterium]MBP9818972.1 nucleoside triphosphate pyrophosphohydrolase family protein [Candidatus Paceibacterota bacterium]
MEKLTFEQYDAWLSKNILNPQKDLLVQVLGICGEAGEIAEKMKKIVRDKAGVISEEDKVLMAKELGDVLWYLARFAQSIDTTIEDVARMNMEKLESRVKRGVVSGEGDER